LDGDFEYIVVGSGAGGGTVAARLAEAGRRVLVLEAGGDPRALQGAGPVTPDTDRLPDDYDVPAFHAMAAENHAMKWDFFVRHYADEVQQQRDPKYVKEEKGILYPRAGCLGGCTAHNALITVRPHRQDWDDIVSLTGDTTWSSKEMQKYWQRIERCRHRGALRRCFAKIGVNLTEHGWKGWLQTEKVDDSIAIGDNALFQLFFETIGEALDQIPNAGERIGRYLATKGDPNDGRYEDGDEGVRYTPLSTRKKVRTGTRERLLEVAAAHPGNLKIEMDALATRVLLDDNKRAIGVEYLKGKRLYQAHHDPSAEAGELRKAMASREIILAGGAFNTPQLLMLSGIGPPEELKKHEIAIAVPLPGVGLNLQDRYEMGVVNRMRRPWRVLEGATFTAGDPLYEQWKQSKKGTYTSNGAALGVVKRSFPARPLPDLFCFALIADFRGYYPGYSKALADKLNSLTWAILKAHTKNTAGEVRLASKDPRQRPFINFRYFQESNDHNHEDIDSIVEGIKFVRKLTAPLKKEKVIEQEEFPGDHIQSDDELRTLVYDHAWGHHASCTCRIGPDGDEMAVLDSKLRVRGARNLRVVDASVFPRIPGFFIASSIFMVGEKAADMILADAS